MAARSPSMPPSSTGARPLGSSTRSSSMPRARWRPPAPPPSWCCRTSIGLRTVGWCRPTSSTPLQTTNRLWPRVRPWLLGAAVTSLLGVSLWRRLAILHQLSFDYDEGVYWQSLESMRQAHHLFSEVFSSQPPLFLGGLSPMYNLLD